MPRRRADEEIPSPLTRRFFVIPAIADVIERIMAMAMLTNLVLKEFYLTAVMLPLGTGLTSGR